MKSLKYPHLFEPIRLGGTLFKNRIFAAPTGYQNMTLDNILPLGAAAYYGRKALGGAASVATCELITDGELGRGGYNQVAIDDPRAFKPLCRVADAISRHGAVATAELQHWGMYSNRMPIPWGGEDTRKSYAPAETATGGSTVPEMPEEIIERTIEKYARAALTAKQAGFGMILLHAGHGWLLHQFLSPRINTRRDKWGGPSIENRARLTVEICRAIKKVCGADFPLEVRISGSECPEVGYGIEEGRAFARQLDGECDLIHVSAGIHEVEEVFAVTHPSMFLGEGPNVYLAAEIKKHVKTPVATVGAIGEPEMMEDIIASGKADVVEMARALLADPDIPVKIMAGREDEINRCMRCLNCFSSQRARGVPNCAINPETGCELEMLYGDPETRVKKRVLVAGGGIAGMEAALELGRRGHEVVLCEKSRVLGGAIRCEKNVPFKRRLDIYINSQAKKLAASGVDVRLDTEVTPEYAEKLGADVIIAALGSRAVKPPIEGIDGKSVLAAEYADLHPDETAQETVILGAGLVGLELAVYLAMNGKNVTVLEKAADMNDGGNPLHAIGLRAELRHRAVKVIYNAAVTEINDGGVTYETEGKKERAAAGTVIYATGRRSESDAALALRHCAPEYYQIGDCLSVGNITAATSSAFWLARDIGRF